MNGKAYTQEAKQSPFAFSQQQPGEFKITSIAQQQKMCKSVVADLSYAVHPHPTAQVGQGNKIFQDIHEGKGIHQSLKGPILTSIRQVTKLRSSSR